MGAPTRIMRTLVVLLISTVALLATANESEMSVIPEMDDALFTTAQKSGTELFKTGTTASQSEADLFNTEMKSSSAQGDQYDPHQDAINTINLITSKGSFVLMSDLSVAKGDNTNACKGVAKASLEEIKSNVNNFQRIIDGIAKGFK